MALYRIQGKAEKQKGIYYEFDSGDEPLGEGGMGKVYKGRCIDEVTGKSRFVAVKFMFSDLPPYAIEKARREAAIHFRHDNLIEMLGFIETESKTVLGEPLHHYHVVSELLEGVSLDKMFEGKLTDQQGHYVPYAEKLYKDYQQDVNHFAVVLIKSILSGLMAMHDAGYIHRDIDPTNIMITTDGHIKLIDFGIAKKMNSLTSHDKHLTQAGQFIGKPEYASPELVLGAISEQNQTTDIYAVGILLFQCIVGHVPFEGDRSDVLQKQLHSPVPVKLIKNKGLREIVAKATEKSRAKRFQSAAEFRVALDQINLSKGNAFEWKPFYNYIIGGLSACALVGLVVSIWPKPQEIVPPVQTQPESVHLSYDTVVASLHNPSSASKGLKDLQLLSDSGDAAATYLLSRLYFKSLLADDYCPDSINTLQLQLSITTDNTKAHDLLEKAVEQDPKNYHALYELAHDYWKAKQRTEAVEKRDGDQADYYYHQALPYAREADDTRYITMIEGLLEDVKRWRANEEVIKKYR